jgi:co-chaperonin GroES (HSP10)
MALLKMDHAIDPKEDLFNKLGDLSGVDIAANRVLCAVYQRPEKLKSGIVLPNSFVNEDKYQGKIGLIVKAGPLAFDTESEWFAGIDYKVGDWVMFRPSDGWSLNIHDVLCRIIDDVKIAGKINNCDEVW